VWKAHWPAGRKIWSAGRATVLAMRTFLARPPTNRRTPSANPSRLTVRCSQLRANGTPAQNRAGDELGEKEDVKRHVLGVGRRLPFAAIHVNHVGQRVEGEKRNANRQRDVRRMNRSDARQIQCGIEQANNEIGVFKESEQADVDEHRDGNGEFAVRRCFRCGPPTGRGRSSSAWRPATEE
jgi:hypothetical protein